MWLFSPGAALGLGEGTSRGPMVRETRSSSESQVPPRVMFNQSVRQSLVSALGEGASLCATGQSIFQMQKTEKESK